MFSLRLLVAILSGVLVFGLPACKAPLRMANADWQTFRVADTIRGEEPAIEAIIKPYRDILEAEMEEIIGQASVKLTRGQPESTLGNFVGDLLMAMGPVYFDQKADFALHNQGGLRIPELPAGGIRVSDIYQLMPFDNTVVLLDVPAEIMPTLFDRMAQSGGWPVSREVSYRITDGKAEAVTIGGKPLESGKTYRVLMPDYVAIGGSNCDFLKPLPRIDSGVFTRDVIIRYIRSEQASGRTLSSQIEGRVSRTDRTP